MPTEHAEERGKRRTKGVEVTGLLYEEETYAILVHRIRGIRGMRGPFSLFMALFCTGCRIGMVGLGPVAARKTRAVKLDAQWCPDDRHVLVRKHDTRVSEDLTFWILAWDVDDPNVVTELDRSLVYLVDARGKGGRRKLGRGEEPVPSPDSRFVAFRERPTRSFLGFWRQRTRESLLHLADAATGRRWTLDRHVTYYEFSPDGRWLAWGTTKPVGRFVVDVRRPDHPIRLRTGIAAVDKAERAHWPGFPGPWPWGADGALYVAGFREGEGGRQSIRWVRLAPPHWQSEDIEVELVDGLPRPVRELQDRLVAAARRNPLRSADGSLLLTKRSRTIEIPQFGSWNPLQWLFVAMYWLGMPEMTFTTENLYVQHPDGTRRRLTRFVPPW